MERPSSAAWLHLRNLVKSIRKFDVRLSWSNLEQSLCWSNLVQAIRVRRGEVTIKDAHLENIVPSKNERVERHKLIAEIKKLIGNTYSYDRAHQVDIKPVLRVRRPRQNPIFHVSNSEAIFWLTTRGAKVNILDVTLDIGDEVKCAYTPRGALYLYVENLQTTDGKESFWIPIHHIGTPNYPISVLIALKKGLQSTPSVS